MIFQDNIHFSMLGQNPEWITRFAAYVVSLLPRFNLTGVNLEWIEPTNHQCGSPYDWSTLMRILRELQRIAHANAFPIVLAVKLHEHNLDSQVRITG